MVRESTYVEQYINTEEPVLFETNSFMLDKHSRDFNKFNYTKRNVATLAINTIATVMFVISAIATVIMKDYTRAVLYIIGAVIVSIYPFFVFKKSAVAATQNAYHNNNVNNYKFYQNCFVNTDNFTISAVPYDIVVEAHETEEYFYLFISKIQAHIIPKDSFVYNTPEEMRKLLTMKLGSRFIVHCSR